MPDLLLELGTEELPASSVERAYTEMAAKVVDDLISLSILKLGVVPIAMGTPRRLIVAISGIDPRQPDSTKEMRGPGIKSAYDSNGQPTQALLGFCRGQGIEPSELRNDGQYVWATKRLKGAAAVDILAELLPKVIRSLTFDKTMRWGSGKMRFARPIRWIVALLDTEVVPFNLEGVDTSNLSHGHRFYSPGPFEVSSLESLLAGLRERGVEPNPASRREMIEARLPIESGDFPEIPEALLDENVFLTEWPTPILGRFSEPFLSMPEPVLTTVMAKHERMFPVRDGDGKVTRKFIFVRNSGEAETVRKGCEWVLNARLNDAKFFFDEDARFSLDEFLERTKRIVFQEKLGTVYDRSTRLVALIDRIGFSGGDPNDPSVIDELELGRLAARYAKADLSTGLVSELASLQGVIGGIYAKRAGLPDPVVHAITHQYETSAHREVVTQADRTAARLAMADQIDKLVGYLGIGLEPTGSSDPYGLRRAINVLIEIAWTWPEKLPDFAEYVQVSVETYRTGGIALDFSSTLTCFQRLFASRYPNLMPETRRDLLEASIQIDDRIEASAPQAVRFRASVLGELALNEFFVQTATRPLNILATAIKKDLEFQIQGNLDAVSHPKLDSPSGEQLYAVIESIEPSLEAAIDARNVEDCVSRLLALEAPINRFFEETMVMAEDPSVRYARLTVVKRASKLLFRVGDFRKIVFKGGAEPK
jgi:glycyl-tRNA synthetase beta chain